MMSLKWKSPKPSFSFIPRVRRDVAQHTLNIAQEVWQGAVDRTDVDTGDLRASWNLSQGRPNLATVSGGISGSPLPAPTMLNLAVTALSKAKFFVSNGKHYVVHVEYGSPTITPRLMLTRAIQAVDL